MKISLDIETLADGIGIGAEEIGFNIARSRCSLYGFDVGFYKVEDQFSGTMKARYWKDPYVLVFTDGVVR